MTSADPPTGALAGRAGLGAAITLVMLLAYGPGAAAWTLTAVIAIVAIAWLQVRMPWPEPLRAALAGAELAALVALAFAPNPFAPVHAIPGPMILQSPVFLLGLVLVAFNAVALKAGRVAAAGGTLLAGWALAKWLVAAAPDTIHKSQINDDLYDTLIGYLAAITRPHYLNEDLWVLQMFVGAAVTAVLIIAALRAQGLAARLARQEGRRAALAAHFAPDVAASLAGTGPLPANPLLGGPRRLAVLDADLVGFTTWAEAREPGEVATALRAWHGYVRAAVFTERGAVLAYVGDGVLALFGLVEGGEPATPALACAKALAADWAAESRRIFGDAPLALALGVDVGEVRIGLAGESQALSLLAVGEPVSGAARLQRATRLAGAPVLVSEAVRTAVGGPPDLQPAGGDWSWTP
jgi:adenylate cyclase